MWLGELKTSFYIRLGCWTGILSYFIANRKLLVNFLPGPVAQSVASQTSHPGVASSIPAQSHSFLEIDHEIFYHGVLVNHLVKMCG